MRHRNDRSLVSRMSLGLALLLGLIVPGVLAMSTTVAGAAAPQNFAMSNGSGTLPGATVGHAYSVQLVVPGGLPAGDIYGLTDSLPTGLHLNQTTGLISGTPELPQTSSFEVSPNGNGKVVLNEVLSLTVISGVPSGDSTLIPLGNDVVGTLASVEAEATTLLLDLQGSLSTQNAQTLVDLVLAVFQCGGLPTPTCN